jgi:hypothetical protein
MTEINFNDVNIEHKELFNDFLNKYPAEISDITFTNIFCWRKANMHKFAIFNEHLIISGIDKKQGMFFYQPVGPNPASVIRDLLDLFPESSVQRVEKHVAEELANEYNIVGDRANYDYVYKVEDLKSLKGAKYEPKRILMKKFAGYYAEVCELNDSNISEFIKAEDEWCLLNECAKKKSLSDEDVALREVLTNYQQLGVYGVCLKIWGNIKGFAIGEPLKNGVYVEHFEKASIGFFGIYQTLLNEFSARVPNDFPLLNRGQDTGVEAVRKAKESYYPVALVEKFIIRKKA